MRLHPPVTQDEAQSFLTSQAVAALGEDAAAGLAPDIAILAEAMSIIGAVELPDELEPLFP